MRVRVLGCVQVTDAVGRALPPPERKARQLLTVLVWSAPAAVSLDALADVLWDDPPDSATKTIRAHLSRLGSLLARAGLEHAVVRATATGYRLDLPPDTTDVDVVARLRRRGTQVAADGRPDAGASLLAEARRLWTGDLELPGTTGALPLARAAQRRRDQLVHDHLRCLVDGTDPGAAVPELAGLTAADRTDEPLWALYVRALHRSGHHAEAVRALATARNALDEIGLALGPDLRQLETEVYTGTPPPGPGSPEPAPPMAAPRPADGEPAVAYTGREGARVAYCVLPGGPRDHDRVLVVLNPAMITIDGLLDEPRARRALAARSPGSGNTAAWSASTAAASACPIRSRTPTPSTAGPTTSPTC